jgi:hypothetical protein
MSYADAVPMMKDETLAGRIGACVLEQASLKDPEADPLAKYAMAQPPSVTDQFMSYFGADQALVGDYTSGGEAGITDGAILSKVQAVWDDVTVVLNLSAAA